MAAATSRARPGNELVDVTAPCGTVRGRIDGDVAVFRGIRYAAPPTGQLRFAPPQPVRPAPVGEVLDGTEFGPISLQDIDPLPVARPAAEHNFYAVGARASEDCLNLSVWTPDPAGHAPVLVWIHGGAFLYGSGTGAWIDGAALARDHGIVVVTVNYRLGILGGLYLGDLAPRHSNFALQDQIIALRWVRQNIAAFGGDPAAVTVGGQSAGAMSTAALLAAPEARDLFARAIVESGHADATVSLESARRAARRALRCLRIDPDGTDVLARLRSVSTFRIADVQRELGVGARIFPLVGDDVVLPADPLRVIASGSASKVDLLIGTTREEHRLFEITGWAAAASDAESVLAGLVPDPAIRADAIRIYRSVPGSAGADPAIALRLILSEHGWAEPARRLATAHARAGGRTYFYEFAWGWPARGAGVGAAHLADLPFFFGNLHQPGVREFLGPAIGDGPAASALAAAVSSSVAQFVTSGDLTDCALGTWPAFAPGNRVTMVIDSEPAAVADHIADRLDFWEAHRADTAAPLESVGQVSGQ